MNYQLMTIRQLAERAGVTQRTIRYYTDEGLIDAPVDKVRMPRYTERHLLQLQAAAHLKASYMPLRVIRARLAGLGDSELQELINSVPQPVQVLNESAVEYAVAQHHVPQVIQGKHAIPDVAEADAVTTASDTRRWYRVVIDDGIELHFRDDRQIDGGDLRRLNAMLRRRP